MSSNSYTIFSGGATSVSSFPLPQAQQVWAKSIDLGFPKGNKRKNFRDRVKWRQEFEKPLDPPIGKLWFCDFPSS